MKQHYLRFFLFLLLGFSLCLNAQEQAKEDTVSTSFSKVEEISIYPNPVTQGKVNILTPDLSIKQIEIFDVLGKKVIDKTTYEKTIDVSKLSPGVYVIKLKQRENTTTRKLVIR